MGEEGLGAGLELAIAVREEALATGGVDVARRHPAVREGREQFGGPRLRGPAGRRGSRLGPAGSGPSSHGGRARGRGRRRSARGRSRPPAGGSTETRGRSRSGEQVAIVGMARGAPAQQGDGREPVGLGGRIVADQGAGGLPERDEPGVHVLPERSFPPAFDGRRAIRPARRTARGRSARRVAPAWRSIGPATRSHRDPGGSPPS